MTPHASSPKQTELQQNVHAAGQWLRKHGPSWRAFVIAALLLILFDLGVRWLAHEEMQRDDFHIAWRSSALVEEYLEALGAYDGPWLAMIGDSTLQPLPQLPRSATVPYFVQEQLREATRNHRWKAANLGLTGAHTIDMLSVARLLPQNTRFVIITLNYKFLGPHGMRPLHLYPELAVRASQVAPLPQQQALPLRQRLKQAPKQLVNDCWFLLRNGDWLADRVFGDRPGNWLRRRLDEVALPGASTARDDLHRRWTPEYAAQMRIAMQVGELSLQNPTVRNLGKTLAYLKARNIAFVVYFTPLDWAHMNQYRVGNRKTVLINVERIGAQIENHGGIFLNLIEIGQPDWFFDMDHLTEKGRRELAQLLVNDIRWRVLLERRERP